MDRPTVEQVRVEPAGQQLDGWLAEYVMGWELLGHRMLADLFFREPGSGEVIGVPCDLSGASERSPFNPSRSIAAAWLVVEKHPYATLQKCDRDGSAETTYWTCSLQPPGGGVASKASGGTAPLAICRAALLAVLSL